MGSAPRKFIAERPPSEGRMTGVKLPEKTLPVEARDEPRGSLPTRGAHARLVLGAATGFGLRWSVRRSVRLDGSNLNAPVRPSLNDLDRHASRSPSSQVRGTISSTEPLMVYPAKAGRRVTALLFILRCNGF